MPSASDPSSLQTPKSTLRMKYHWVLIRVHDFMLDQSPLHVISWNILGSRLNRNLLLLLGSCLSRNLTTLWMADPWRNPECWACVLRQRTACWGQALFEPTYNSRAREGKSMHVTVIYSSIWSTLVNTTHSVSQTPAVVLSNPPLGWTQEEREHVGSSPCHSLS